MKTYKVDSKLMDKSFFIRCEDWDDRKKNIEYSYDDSMTWRHDYIKSEYRSPYSCMVNMMEDYYYDDEMSEEIKNEISCTIDIEVSGMKEV